MAYLDFEKPIADFEARLVEMKKMAGEKGLDLQDAIHSFEEQLLQLKKDTYGKLTRWQRVQLSRHPDRPYALDYIEHICDEFIELHGDRTVRDDKAMIGGLGRIGEQSIMFIGQQKGRNTKQRQMRNFGMANPEGYRKALRLMEMAEKFKMPVLTFIDTPGAYPGVGAEERGQSEAIARNLKVMAGLKVPVVCTVIGEGGSGGALAIGVGDRVNMLQFSTYSVISPEGCASILWKSADKASEAAEAMGITSSRLKELKLIDQVIAEPLGGAHRDPSEMALRLKQRLLTDLAELAALSEQELLESRYQRLMRVGRY